MSVPQITHPFWGNIIDTRGKGYTGEIVFQHPFFLDKPFSIGLGDHNIEYTPKEQKENPALKYKPLEEIFGPQLTWLDEFADTYKDFIDNIDTCLHTFSVASFGFYKEYLAEQYDGEAPIDTIAAHNEHLRYLADINIHTGRSITLLLYYDLLNAPIHFVMFTNGKLDNIHGEAIKPEWLNETT